jgi:hypothetical protein
VRPIDRSRERRAVRAADGVAAAIDAVRAALAEGNTATPFDPLEAFSIGQSEEAQRTRRTRPMTALGGVWADWVGRRLLLVASGAMRWLLLVALLLAGCGSAREVPDVRGMTVPTAQRALQDAGLRAELDTTLVRSADGHFVPGPPGTRVSHQYSVAGKHAREGDVVALGTGRRAGLLPAAWERFAYRDGLVCLHGLKSCIDPDHIELRPAMNGVRVVELVGRRAGRDCPKRIVFDPGPGWSKATIAAPTVPAEPAPELDRQRRDARIVSHALLPDGHTVLVQYETGGCPTSRLPGRRSAAAPSG